MAQYVFVVYTNPVTGQDTNYHNWYNNQHLSDVTRIAGFVAAQRFEFVPIAGTTQPTHRYLALYTVETDDLATTHETLMAAVGSSALPMSNALDREGAAMSYFRPLGQAHKAADRY
jgi:hypothetical protein